MKEFYYQKYGQEIVDEIIDQYSNLERGGGSIALSIFELFDLKISRQTIYNILRAFDIPIRQKKSKIRQLQERIDELERQIAELKARNEVLELYRN